MTVQFEICWKPGFNTLFSPGLMPTDKFEFKAWFGVNGTFGSVDIYYHSRWDIGAPMKDSSGLKFEISL